MTDLLRSARVALLVPDVFIASLSDACHGRASSHRAPERPATAVMPWNGPSRGVPGSPLPAESRQQTALRRWPRAAR